MSTIESFSKHKKIFSSIIYSLRDLTGLYYSNIDWNTFLIRKYKKIMKIASCYYNNDYLSSNSHVPKSSFANCEQSYNQEKLTHSKNSFKKYYMNEIYSPNSLLCEPLINSCSFPQSVNMNMSSNYHATDKFIRNKLSDLNNYILNIGGNTHGTFNGKATSVKLAELYNFSQSKDHKAYLNSNIHKRQNRSCHIGGDKSNKIPKKMQNDFVRYFSSNKILCSLDDEKENTREKHDKTWTKKINENCKVTYHVKKNGNVEKAQYTVECKDNGEKMQFSPENLSTGQKLIGAVMTLFFVIAAAYCTIFFMSLAASVLVVAAIAAFCITCYQIMKKGWKNRGR